MSFTEEEQRLWYAARRLGLDPEDCNAEDVEVAEQQSKRSADIGDDDSGVPLLSECAQCGHDLGSSSDTEFPLCAACEG